MGDILEELIMLPVEAAEAAVLTAIQFNNIVDILKGMGEIFIGTIETLALGTPALIDTGFTLFEYAFTNVTCGVKLLTNFTKCWYYYAWNMFLELLWLPFAVLLLILSAFGIPLKKYVDKFWHYLYELDCITSPIIGWSYMHWSKDVNDLCFNCCRVKFDAVINKGQKFTDVLNITGPQFLTPGIDAVGSGVSSFMNPFG